ncbi:MAG TPA: PHB depolymerase family esterase [Kofleriaceae bacterium]|nr:PHB depolymerase family esterase [Kofleriaceae bacterium]
MQPVASFGTNPGALAMYEYVPDGLAAGRPLVVVLHGCTQQASAMEAAGWNKLADELGFAVVYPEQSTDNNPVRCFNWAGEYGDTANLERGRGENESIMEMIDHAIAAHGSDDKRVYIVGFSAGAAFTAVMLATWPERFAGGAIMSGVAYRCATTVNGAYSCQNPGTSKTAAAWGDLVRGASSFTGPWPRLQIWHGASDTIVATMNAGELVKQWTNVHGTDDTADAIEKTGKDTMTQYKAGANVVVEEHVIDTMGHAVVIGGADCPSTTGAYFSDQGVCSTRSAAAFFDLAGDGSGSGSGSGSDSGSGSGNDGDGDGEPDTDLPGCSFDAAGGARGFAMVVVGIAFALRRRRR